MRVYAVCQDELVIRSLNDVLLPSFEVDFLVENRPVARRLHEAGMIDSSPNQLIADGTDWRFLNELKRELKA